MRLQTYPQPSPAAYLKNRMVIRGPRGFAGLAAIRMGVPMELDPNGAYINTPDQPQYASTVQSNSPADPTALLQGAKTALLGAGYGGAECRTEKVYSPDGSFYTQNICSAPGYTGGDEANLVAKLTPQQLAAQRAYELANGEGAQPAYFQMTQGAPNMQVSNYTGGSAAPAVQAPAKTTAPAPAAPANKPATGQPASGGSMPVNGTVTAGGLSLPALSDLFSASLSMFGFDVPYWMLGAGLLALPFLFGGRRS